MKKIIVILSFFMLTSLFFLKAQEYLELTHRHELKLNMGTSVFFAFPEVSYEYLISDDMSVGTSVGFGLYTDTEEGDGYNFKATPYLRWFFNRSIRQPAAGFFLEANAAIGSQDIYSYDYTDYNYKSIKEKSITTGGMGLAAGWKYLSRNNWVGEIYGGAGRNFKYDKEYDDSNRIYARIGISIGKRF